MDQTTLPGSDTSLIGQVKFYHQQTKHDFHRYARSLGYLDWANQPDPFRRYEGAPLIQLPLLSADDAPTSPPYDDLYQFSRIPPQELSLAALSRLFEYGLSITAWKEYGGNRWALRANPSSGNLHPTEGYLVIGASLRDFLAPGVYHYAPKEHALEQRARFAPALASELLRDFPEETVLIGLSSIHWREAWKYGERAFRYCQHDIGHAIGTLRIAAATLGWRMALLTGLADQTIGTLLGLDRGRDFHGAEAECPELVAAIWPDRRSAAMTILLALNPELVEQVRTQQWFGTANRLSRDEPISWKIIDTVTRASYKPPTAPDILALLPTEELPSAPMLGTAPTSPSAHQIIHQRRSAVAFDGHTSLRMARMMTMLQRVMPCEERLPSQRPIPWDAIPWPPTIHLALFVHRVVALPPGLYILVRSTSSEVQEQFRRAMHEQFAWVRPDGCPPKLPLFLLEEGNAQKIATQVSCWQDIGGDSAVALGMIAEFDAALERYGPWFYRRLFWEAGLIGQVLYLEAEAAGVRATGIGCFFDDPVHRILGFPDTRFQSLYHFTIGGPVEDRRLTTLPPYGNHDT